MWSMQAQENTEGKGICTSEENKIIHIAFCWVSESTSQPASAPLIVLAGILVATMSCKLLFGEALNQLTREKKKNPKNLKQ